MKSIYKIAIVSLVVGVTVAAFAQEVDATSTEVEEVATEEVTTEAVVTDRVDCEEIKVKIAELSAIEEPDDETVAELTELKAQQRKSCMRHAGARSARSATRGRGAPIKNPEAVASPVVSETEVETDVVAEVSVAATPSVCDVPDENGCCPGEKYVDMGELGFNCCPESGGDCFPPIKTEPTPEEVTKNIEAGLCADGSKPNKFGCCGEEVFKDLGNTVFACCPKGWEKKEDCFPPIKK